MKNKYKPNKGRLVSKKGPHLQVVCTLFLLMFVTVQVLAQQSGAINSANEQTKEVSGVVTDENGEGIPGVNVLIKGTSTGTTTDIDGRYRLGVPGDESVLVFSFVGYLSEEATVGNRTVIDMGLLPNIQSLQEVVVVGYGTQKKVTVTGSVASIDDEQIITTKNENIQNMLTGKVAGVRIVQNSSEPGSFDNSFDIRGFGSPLIVIDGVPRGNFSQLDPNDVESISVLKDASAAIYGVRAANGVVLITTKKGKGPVELNYSGHVGFQQPSGLPRSVDAVDWMTLFNEKQMNNPNGGTIAYTEEDMAPYRDGTRKSTDWFTPVIREYSPQTQHNISVNGSSDKVDYYVSLGYLFQEGFWKSGDLNYEKFNVRSNVGIQLHDRLKVELKISGIQDQKEQPYGSTWNVFKSLWRQSPIDPYYANNNSEYLGNAADGMHPEAITSIDRAGYQRNNHKWFQSSFSLTYEVPHVKGLDIKGMYAYDYNMSEQKAYKKAFSLYSYDAATDVYTESVNQAPSTLRRYFSHSPSSLMQLSLNYDRAFKKHNIGALVLYEERSGRGDNFYSERELVLSGLDELIAGSSENQIANMNGNGLYEDANKGLVGRLNYDFASKYLAEFSFRYDGSSKFPVGKQWGFFPAVSVGWRLSEEKFIKNADFLSFVDNLKIRASYGKMGDDGASSYQFITGYDYPSGGNPQELPAGYVFDGAFTNGLGFRQLPNLNITWYEVKTLNVGVDADFWDGKLGLTFDIFKRDRDGLLATRRLSLPGSLGAGLPQVNLNSDQNRGFEFTVNHRNRIGDFNYGISGNFAYARARWTSYDRATDGNSYNNWRNNLNDRNKDIWWGYGEAGQFNSYEEIYNNYVINDGQGNRSSLPGDYKYEDWNEDGVIDGWDTRPIATKGVPNINYGLTLYGSYKGFDINLLFQGTEMVSVSYPEQLSQPLMWNGNALEQFMDRWHPKNPLADPFDPNTEWVSGHYAYTGSAVNENSGHAIQDASYLRLKSAEIGYTVPESLTKKIGVKRTRLYVNAYNLFTWSDLKYVDPEHPADTYGYIYPLNKTINFGLNITL